MSEHAVSTRSLATLAAGGVIAFAGLVLVLHVIQRGRYHPLSEAVSELALGRGGWLMGVAFCALGTGTLALAVVVRRTVGGTAGPLLLVVGAACTFASAAVHADGETAATTLHGQVHQALGICSFVTLIATMFVCARRFRRDPAWRSLALPTLGWACAAAVAVLGVPLAGTAAFGVAQRILLAVLLSWTLTVALYGRRVAAAPGRAPGRVSQAGGVEVSRG